MVNTVNNMAESYIVYWDASPLLYIWQQSWDQASKLYENWKSPISKFLKDLNEMNQSLILTCKIQIKQTSRNLMNMLIFFNQSINNSCR